MSPRIATAPTVAASCGLTTGSPKTSATKCSQFDSNRRHFYPTAGLVAIGLSARAVLIVAALAGELEWPGSGGHADLRQAGPSKHGVERLGNREAERFEALALFHVRDPRRGRGASRRLFDSAVLVMPYRAATVVAGSDQIAEYSSCHSMVCVISRS